MNLDYKGAVETLEGLGISSPESYLERALKVYNFDSFPESGLNDEATGKLMKTAVDIAHADERLVQKRLKTDYSLNPKEKVSGDLGTQILREELDGNLKKVGIGIGKVTKSTIQGIVAGFTIPYYIQRIKGLEKSSEPVYSNIVYSILGGLSNLGLSGILISIPMITYNPKLIPYLIGTPIATNVISLIHELRRNKKKIEAEIVIPEQKNSFFEWAKKKKKIKDPFGYLGSLGWQSCPKCSLEHTGYHDCIECTERNKKKEHISSEDIIITDKEFYEEIKLPFPKEKRGRKKCHHECSVCNRTDCCFYGTNQYP